MKYTEVSPAITRVEVPALPGITKPIVRHLTAKILDRSVRRVVKQCGISPTAVVVAFPLARFPRSIEGPRFLYVTDDWLEGSTLMGFSEKHMRSVLKSNLSMASAVAAVSPIILDRLSSIGQIENQFVLPNGCPYPLTTNVTERERIIGLIGQLNERLDIDLLESLQRTGERILVIGPRTDRDIRFSQRLSAFLEAANVEWLGSISSDLLPGHLSRISLGITPYADTTFNRASFPLKTLEYLSAGLPVIATDSPAIKWLDCSHIRVAHEPEEFVAEVRARLDIASTPDEERERRQFAKKHSWPQRAIEFVEIVNRLNKKYFPDRFTDQRKDT